MSESFLNKWNTVFSGEKSRTLLDSLGLQDFRVEDIDPHLGRILERSVEGNPISRDEAIYLTEIKNNEIPYLLLAASIIRNQSKGNILSYSKNVFVPITQLCRNHCGYCTFKIEPGEGALLISPENAIDIAKKGADLGCTELLFVTGDKPELTYEVYRDALAELGFSSTSEYLINIGIEGLKHGIFPHTNLGLSNTEELSEFRKSNPSMGLMLENISNRLLKKGNAHHRCADKVPKLRMKTMEDAGELRIPWTSGILVGIGETWEERIDSLLALKELNDKYGHIQEIIVQNFVPKEGILMEKFPPPTFADMLKTVAISRLVFDHDMNIQIPPNLNNKNFSLYVFAGINDLGGVSPLTIDYVNPESPWPQVDRMQSDVEELGFILRERLPVYPEFIDEEFIDPFVLAKVNESVDEKGFVPRS